MFHLSEFLDAPVFIQSIVLERPVLTSIILVVIVAILLWSATTMRPGRVGALMWLTIQGAVSSLIIIPTLVLFGAGILMADMPVELTSWLIFFVPAVVSTLVFFWARSSLNYQDYSLSSQISIGYLGAILLMLLFFSTGQILHSVIEGLRLRLNEVHVANAPDLSPWSSPQRK